jgi:hypothetical protein
MSTPHLVGASYGRIWNAGEYAAIADLVAEHFVFRGLLGAELKGRIAFTEYVRSVRDALAEYRCEILPCVSETDQAFAKLRFSGLHVGPGHFEATRRPESSFTGCGGSLVSLRR